LIGEDRVAGDLPCFVVAVAVATNLPWVAIAAVVGRGHREGGGFLRLLHLIRLRRPEAS
jgi:hypothetical protein